MSNEEEAPATLDAFYKQLAETHEAPVREFSKIHTKMADITRLTERQMKVQFYDNLYIYEPLKAAQIYPGVIMTLGAEQVKYANPKPKDSIYKALEEAGLDFEYRAPRTDGYNFGEQIDQSSDSDVDFYQLQINSSRLNRYTSDIIRLRLVLKYNEAKLRRWAKIKSKSFRKIHNKERRAEKMQRIQDKLAIGIQAAQDAGFSDLAYELLYDKQDFLANVYDGGVSRASEHDRRDAYQLDDKPSDLQRLRFISNVVNGERPNELLGKATRDFSGNHSLETSYTGNYNADMLTVSAEDSKPRIVPGYLSEVRFNLARQIEEVYEDDYQQETMAYIFSPSEEIYALKKSEVVVPSEKILPGWGEWTGLGASYYDQLRYQKKVQTAEMKRKQQEQQQWDGRTDLQKNKVFETANINQEVFDKYSAKRLNVSDEQYEKYLKYSLLPEFYTITNRIFYTYESITTVRGQMALYQEELESNIRELERLNRQLANQKKLIKGQRLPGGESKRHFY